jgi:hypothetical protein
MRQRPPCRTFSCAANDLSRVVSKYIGETEEHLVHAFSVSRTRGVPVARRADALFGKRRDVKDAHDRYANVEVDFLLRRMESFAGLTILTTNSRQNLELVGLSTLPSAKRPQNP